MIETQTQLTAPEFDLVLVSPGMQAFRSALDQMQDELEISRSPLPLDVDRLTNTADSPNASVSYFALNPYEPSYDLTKLNGFLSRLNSLLLGQISLQQPPVLDPIIYQDDMLPKNKEVTLAARLGLSEHIGSYAASRTVTFDTYSGLRPISYGKRSEVRHKMIADIYPEKLSALYGRFKDRSVIFPDRKSERKLKRSIKAR